MIRQQWLFHNGPEHGIGTAFEGAIPVSGVIAISGYKGVYEARRRVQTEDRVFLFYVWQGPYSDHVDYGTGVNAA